MQWKIRDVKIGRMNVIHIEFCSPLDFFNNKEIYKQIWMQNLTDKLSLLIFNHICNVGLHRLKEYALKSDIYIVHT